MKKWSILAKMITMKTDEKRLNLLTTRAKKATFTIQNLMSERGQGVRPLQGRKSTAIPLGSGGRCVGLLITT